MNTVKHLNSGSCDKCYDILNKYGEPPERIKEFFEDVVSRHKDAHIAFAGRGMNDQELFFQQGTSKAHWGESPHNYNLAIDLFRLTFNRAEWLHTWYEQIWEESKEEFKDFAWGGDWNKFKDFPHYELKDWKDMVKNKEATLVEAHPPVKTPQ